MEAEASSMRVNGNYAPHQGYGGIEKPNNYAYAPNTAVPAPPTAPQPTPTSTTPATTSTSASTAQPADIPKDEVGWYFVEQYYMNLSRTPEKLYLFYNKRSQFVSGQETDKVPVCVGQRAINERIKELDFQDCKVRVTNVDSQASDSNIVIQVIGEISNKSQPHRKFTQTFVLAPQVNGYFVLNEIFRYLIDEEDVPEPEAEPAMDEEVQQVPAAESGYQEPPPTLTEVDSKTLTSSADPVAVEADAQQVDREIEEKVLSEPAVVEETAEPTVNGIDEEASHAEDAPVAALSVPAQVATPEPEQTTARDIVERPPEPQPTPSPQPPKEATPPPAPAPAPKPAAPKTWASMAASANRSVATPTTVATPSTTSTTSQARPTPPKTSTPPTSTTPSSATAPPTAPAAQRDESPVDAGQGDEWTPVGGGHNRQQSRQMNVVSQQQQQQDAGPIVRAYIKNVHEGISNEELRAALERFGEVAWLDISRQRNSAFIEFRTPEGYIAALAANPHTVGGERLYVEERRQFNPRGNYQGGRGGGRGGGGGNQGGQQRGGNYQGGGRGGGGYQQRGRGGSNAGAGAARARGGAAQEV